MTPYVFDNVLVAIDGSEGVQRALDCALCLVERLGGRLTAVPAEGKPPAYAATIGDVDEVKQAHGHDLIVIGHKGHFLGDYLLGSTADRVVHHPHCPVIVVPLVGC